MTRSVTPEALEDSAPALETNCRGSTTTLLPQRFGRGNDTNRGRSRFRPLVSRDTGIVSARPAVARLGNRHASSTAGGLRMAKRLAIASMAALTAKILKTWLPFVWRPMSASVAVIQKR